MTTTNYLDCPNCKAYDHHLCGMLKYGIEHQAFGCGCICHVYVCQCSTCKKLRPAPGPLFNSPSADEVAGCSCGQKFTTIDAALDHECPSKAHTDGRDE